MYISHHVFPLYTLIRIHLFIHAVIRLAEIFSIPPEDELDNLEAKCMDYQESNDLPPYKKGLTRLDMWWADVGAMKTNTDQLQFPNLFVLMQCLLILPHSTAKVEGVFSLVRRIKKEFRASLSTAPVFNSPPHGTRIATCILLNMLQNRTTCNMPVLESLFC